MNDLVPTDVVHRERGYYDPCGECPKGTCDGCDSCVWSRQFDRPPVDPLRPDETDDIYVEPYEPEPFPFVWDWLAAIVIVGACVAFIGWWAFLR